MEHSEQSAGGRHAEQARATFHAKWFRDDGGWLLVTAFILAVCGVVGLMLGASCLALVISGVVPFASDLFICVILWEASLRHRCNNKIQVDHFEFPHKFTSLFLVLFLLIALVCSFGKLYLFSEGVHATTTPPMELTSRLDAAYFSAVTITTLGYGDYVPWRSGARCLVLAELLSGVLLLIMVFPVVASRLASFDAEKSERGHISPWYRDSI